MRADDVAPSRHVVRAQRARTLAARLHALPLRVERMHCAIAPVALPSYPDGPRPSSTLELEGDGATGRGEHVGWSDAAHAAFAVRARELPLAGCTTVGEASALARARLADPYDRAAVEAAAIDLALRQASTDLFALTGATPGAVRYVLSFERVADPVARARHELAVNPDLELKIDADPAWGEHVLAGLAALGRVAVLDFKLSGDRAAHLRAHRRLPATLLEDPLPDAAPLPTSLGARVALDAAITCAASVAELVVRPAAVNVKPPRVGGVLEALRVVATCAERQIDVYVGGMFEIGVGRVLAQTLACLLSPGGPNDVAPIARAGAPAERPSRITVTPPHGGGIAAEGIC